jgi:4-amino-4-deoxy-L-arabinose transferase-like glycosyltransferase
LLLEPNSPALMNEAATREMGGAVTASTRTSLRIGDREISQRTIVFVLMLLTFALRIAAAAHLDVICSDGAYYIQCATAFETGNIKQAFQYTGRNIYQPILFAAKMVAGDFENGGKFWGVLVATLTVLPLWGLFRRLFDDRTAAVACFLYAIHPGLIKWAVEPIRDPTYWLLFVLTLYCVERARQSPSPRWFVASGLLTGLSVLTRTEGWLLLIPSLFVVAFPLAKPPRNWSVALVSFLLITVIPVLAVAVPIGYFAGDSDALNLESITGQVDGRRLIATEVTCARFPGLSSPFISTRGSSRLDLTYLEKLAKAYSPGIGLLCLIGLMRFWRLLLKPVHVATAVMNLLLLIAIGYYLRRHGDINTRYYMPVLICSLPFAALQFLKMPSDIATLIKAFPVRPRFVYALIFILLTPSAIVAVYRAPEADLVEMAELGRALRVEHGDNFVLASFGNPFLVSYYASPRKYVGLAEPPSELTWHQINATHPDVIVLYGQAEQVDGIANFLDFHKELEFTPVEPQATIKSRKTFRVYVSQTSLATARAPSASAECKR